MAGVELQINEQQVRSVQEAIQRITPSRNAEEIVGREFLRWAFDTTAIAKRDYLRGPRPRRLGVVTGRLLNSISPEWKRKPWEIAVGTDVLYGRTWELGLGGGPIPKRPFLQPAGERAIKKVPQRLLDHWVDEWRA